MKFTKNHNFFMGLKPASDLQDCSFLVLPIPMEKTTTYGKGTKRGPRAIIKASNQLELYDCELKTSVYKKGIYTLNPLDCKANIKTLLSKLTKKVSSLLQYKPIPFFIGGEHSLTSAIIPAFARKYKNLSILHFDAHADLRPSYEKTKYNHACAMHKPSKKHKIAQVAIRSIAEEELKFTNTENVKTFTTDSYPDIGKLIPKVSKHLTKDVYVSIDVDGFDPSVIPATGTPEPGGFSWYEALAFFKKIFANKNIVGVDVVELSPIKNLPASEFVIAKLIYKLMGYIRLLA